MYRPIIREVAWFFSPLQPPPPQAQLGDCGEVNGRAVGVEVFGERELPEEGVFAEGGGVIAADAEDDIERHIVPLHVRDPGELRRSAVDLDLRRESTRELKRAAEHVGKIFVLQELIDRRMAATHEISCVEESRPAFRRDVGEDTKSIIELIVPEAATRASRGEFDLGKPAEAGATGPALNRLVP